MYKIWFISLSYSLNDKDIQLLNNNVKFLKNRWYKILVHSSCYNKYKNWYLAGEDKLLAEELKKFLTNDFDAIFFTKWGFYVHSILKYLNDLNWNIRTKFFGFSDYSSLLLYLWYKFWFDTYYWLDWLYWIKENIELIEDILGGDYYLEFNFNNRDDFLYKGDVSSGMFIWWITENLLLNLQNLDIDLTNKVLFIENLWWLWIFEWYLEFLRYIKNFNKLSGIIFWADDMYIDWNKPYIYSDSLILPNYKWRSFSSVIENLWVNNVILTNHLGHWLKNYIFKYWYYLKWNI